MKTSEKTLRVVLLVVVIVAASQIVMQSDDRLVGCGLAAMGALALPGYPNQWIFQASGIHQMYEVDPTFVSSALDGKHVYYVRERTFRPHDADSPCAKNQPIRQYASFEQFKQDLENDVIPDDVRWIMYDPEGWDYTPMREQLNPVASIREFGELARAHGFRVITIPHDSFVSRAAKRDAMTTAEAFDVFDIAGVSAEVGDITAVQAQNRQFNPVVFRNYVAKMVARAREVNPKALVFSELSTSPYDYTASPVVRRQATPEELLAAYNAVRDLVDGFYISVNEADEAGIALAFLASVHQEIASASRN